jgi:hypothetical protein
MHYIFTTYRPQHVHARVVSIAFPYKQRSQLSTCGASVNEVWSSCSLMICILSRSLQELNLVCLRNITEQKAQIRKVKKPRTNLRFVIKPSIQRSIEILIFPSIWKCSNKLCSKTKIYNQMKFLELYATILLLYGSSWNQHVPSSNDKRNRKKLKTFRSEALNQTFLGSPPFLNML